LKSYSVLLIGPSSVPFTESGEEATLANLLRSELASLRPDVEWRAAGVMVFQGPGMAERVRRAFEEHRPDLVVLRLATYHLTHEYVLWKIRARWRHLYPAAAFVDERLKWLAGGPRDHANTPRPWVYTVPRWLAAATLGTSTSRSAEESVQNALEALDYLLAQEDMFLYLWRSASALTPKKRDTLEHEQNHAAYWKAVLDYADARHIQITSADARRMFNVERTKSVDGIHGSLEYRQVRPAISR
jgi:hypothetical protein